MKHSPRMQSDYRTNLQILEWRGCFQLRYVAVDTLPSPDPNSPAHVALATSHASLT